MLEDCVFLGICPFPLGCSGCWHVIVEFFYDFLYLYVINSCFFFSFFILFIWVFSLFFLMSVTKGLSILSFQRSSSGFIDLFYIFLVSILLISHLIFMIFIISFFLLTLGFILFIILLDGRLGYLFKIFIVSWGRPLEVLLLHCIDFGKLCFHLHLSWNFSDFLFDFFTDPLVFLVVRYLVSHFSYIIDYQFLIMFGKKGLMSVLFSWVCFDPEGSKRTRRTDAGTQLGWGAGCGGLATDRDW